MNRRNKPAQGEDTQIAIVVRGKHHLVAVRVARVGEVDVVFVDVHRAVRLPVTALDEVHEVVMIIFRQMRRYLDGFAAFTGEPNIVALVDPDRWLPVDKKLKRYSVLLDLGNALPEEGEGPGVQLAVLSFDMEKPRFIHARRLIRKAKMRRLARSQRRWAKSRSRVSEKKNYSNDSKENQA